MTEEEDIDFGSGGIFTDNQATEALRKSAEALGINPDLVAPDGDEPTIRYFAKSGCKHCYGRGVISVCLSPSKQKIFQVNQGVPGRVSKRKITSTNKLRKKKRQKAGPTPKQVKRFLGISPGNELGLQWDTRGQEPLDYKKNNTAKSFCRCIRSVEI